MFVQAEIISQLGTGDPSGTDVPEIEMTIAVTCLPEMRDSRSEFINEEDRAMTMYQSITQIINKSLIVIRRSPDEGTSIRGQGLGIFVIAILLIAAFL